MNFYRNNIYRIISSLFYIVVGLLLVFTNVLLPASNTSTKLILGIIIIAYGIFRAVTAFTSAKKNED